MPRQFLHQIRQSELFFEWSNHTNNWRYDVSEPNVYVGRVEIILLHNNSRLYNYNKIVAWNYISSVP